ncbi:CRISPR-associated endonuclease Cas2, partial [Streptococcus thermophilus]
SFANKFYKKLKMSNLPAGNVRLLAVTEKQFSEMTLIIGGKTKQEEIVSDNKLVVI